jgi:hypothetical protein
MSAELPPDIHVIEGDGSTRYILPRPALGLAHMVGGILFVFGLFPIAMGAWFLNKELRDLGPAPPGPGRIGLVVFLACPSCFILIGALLSLLGVWLLAGHSEIVLTADEIGSAFRLGPIAWRGRRQRRLVRRLVVERASRGTGPGAELASLSAETDAGRPLLLAFFQSPDWLTPLADDLARRWDTPDNPLPVVQRATGQAASRRWRSDRPPEGQRPTPSWFLYVWGTGFFAGGVLCFILILQALVRGDPDGSLQGAYPWKCLWILFPSPFIIPGALALLHVFRRRKTVGLSPEQLKAVEAKTPAGPAPEVEYPTVPAVDHAPGAELPVRLTQNVIPGWGVAVWLGLVLLCSGVPTTLGGFALQVFRAGHEDYGALLGFFTLFFGAIWLCLTGAFVKEFRLWRLGYPVVEVSAVPLYCGDTGEVVVTLSGPATLPRLRIAVLCEEEVSFSEGDDTRKETRRVYDRELASHESFAIERGESFRVRGTFDIPPGAMHSFSAGHHEVRWLVRVEGDAQGLFRLPFKHDYRLAVLPRREPGGTI